MDTVASASPPSLADPSPFPNREPVRLRLSRPVLCVIVDAEEDFLWEGPFSPTNNSTASIGAQRRIHGLFAHYGIRPIYLVTYPLASEPSAIAALREYQADGLCDIGAQLHPWVTPPVVTAETERSSYPGNLPVGVEREKIRRLVDCIASSFDMQPKVYKAGRYGFGPNSAALLEEAGFETDTSLIPRTSYRAFGGPDFAAYDYTPFWFGNGRRLLELPVTRAFTGLLSQRAPRLYQLTESQPMRAMRVGGLLARSGLLERITLSPEGSDLEAMRRLTRALLARGTQIFTLSYHSPSLVPGNTPYVRTPRDLAVFLDRLSGFLSFFRDEVGGEFVTISELRRRLAGGLVADGDTGRASEDGREDGVPRSATRRGVATAPVARGNRGVRRADAAGARCLLVANTFPPMTGGSAVVYDSLARFGGGRVSVLAASEDYRTRMPLQGWREYTDAAPYPLYRIPLLRTPLLRRHAGRLGRVGGIAHDVLIRLQLLHALRRIVRAGGIRVVCIGELVASGWLTRVCRRMLGLKTIIYVHGEEISTFIPYDPDGSRRRGSLAATDGIVAVSRFTRDTLIGAMGVPREKIELISNGVDLHRFTPRPKRADLLARYGLTGRTVLLTVGRLYERKGMDKVIASLPAVHAQRPDIAYLVVGDGPYRATLEAMAAASGVHDRVVFAGAVADHELVDHYALADVFIMANREMPDGDTEGFGLVFLEANACGIPVIAGMSGGSTDAVTNELNGLTVDGSDTAQIAATILRLFGDDALRRRLIDGGKQVAERSGWDHKVQQFLQFCDRIAG
jgi:phosphatidylinositol alpha-1,6-mannosyltransferase